MFKDNYSVKTNLKRLFMQRYERYLPTAFDESMSLLEKMNKIIESHNAIIDVVNTHVEFTSDQLERAFGIIDENLAKQLKKFRDELEEQKTLYEELRDQMYGDLLPDTVKQKLEEWLLNGTIEELILNTVFPDWVERLQMVENKVNNIPLNVKDFGAIGDGVADDWQVIQDVITHAEETGKSVYIPAGEYFVSQPLRTKHMVSALYTKGIHIYGDGKTTIISGNAVGVVDYSNLETVSNGAVFSLHGGNNIIEKMMIRESKVGIFLGQHPDIEARSNSGHNIFNSLWIEEVGTGILSVHSLGNHYNRYNNMHFMHFQIGMHFSKGLTIEANNNNRNMIENVRFSRGWIGILMENGDGNSFKNIYGEGIINNHQAVGGQPSFTPAVLNGKAIFIVNLIGDENTFDTIFAEACDFNIYSTGYRTSFKSVSVQADKVLFPGSPPAVFDNQSTISYGQKMLSDHGLHFQEVDILSNSPDMKSVANNSRQSYKRLGGIGLWQFNIRFERNDDVGSEDVVRIKIPESGSRNLAGLYTRQASSGVTFSFPGFVGNSGTLEMGRCRVSTEEEKDVLGYYHIIIYPPETGWYSGEINNAVFSIHIYDNSLQYT